MADNSNTALLTAALAYGARGWKIFPLKPKSKEPLTRDGFKSATSDPSMIRRWWRDHPNANIGLHLAGSGLVALDIDPRNGGIETFKELEAFYGNPDDILTQLSGRNDGGSHHLFLEPGEHCVQRLGPGVDVKHKGYILLAPSVHPDTGMAYTWAVEGPPHQLPDAWRALVLRPAVERGDAIVNAELTEAQLTTIRDALGHIKDPDRDTWLRVGMALHASGFDQDAWDIWSAGNGGPFDQHDQDVAWRGFRAGRSDATTFRSILKIASEHGWKNRGDSASMMFTKFEGGDETGSRLPQAVATAEGPGSAVAGAGASVTTPQCYDDASAAPTHPTQDATASRLDQARDAGAESDTANGTPLEPQGDRVAADQSSVAPGASSSQAPESQPESVGVAGLPLTDSRVAADPKADEPSGAPSGMDGQPGPGGVAQAPEGEAPKAIRIRALRDLQVQRRSHYMIKGVLPERGIGVIYGHPGTGKTFAALDMAGAVARGTGWHGHRTVARPAAIVAAENPASIRQRLALLQLAGHLAAEDPLYVVEENGAGLDLCKAEVTNAVMEELRNVGVRFVVIDTLATAAPGMDENDAGEMGRLIEAAKAIAAACRGFVLIVHHSGKDETKGARGSSALRGAVDVELLVRRSQGTNRLSIEGTKSRDGQLMDLKWFELERWQAGVDDEGDPVEAARLVSAADPDTDEKKASNPTAAEVFAKPMPKGRNQVAVMRAVDELAVPRHDVEGVPPGHFYADRNQVIEKAAGQMFWIEGKGRATADAVRRERAVDALAALTQGDRVMLLLVGDLVGRTGQ